MCNIVTPIYRCGHYGIPVVVEPRCRYYPNCNTTNIGVRHMDYNCSYCPGPGPGARAVPGSKGGRDGKEGPGNKSGSAGKTSSGGKLGFSGKSSKK